MEQPVCLDVTHAHKVTVQIIMALSRHHRVISLDNRLSEWDLVPPIHFREEKTVVLSVSSRRASG